MRFLPALNRRDSSHPQLKGSHQTPKAIHVVDELPKTAAGKIDKKALRHPYWPEGTRQIH